MVDSIRKTLTANDLGSNTNQDGIHIPKQPSVLEFFPELDVSILNPSLFIPVRNKVTGEMFEWRFVYYNNKHVHGGTRDEYRLTRTNRALASMGAVPGDCLVLERTRSDIVEISLAATGDDLSESSGASPDEGSDGLRVVGLAGGWTMIVSDGEG